MTAIALTIFGVVALTLFGAAAIADRRAARQPRSLSPIDEWVLRTPVDELAAHVADGVNLDQPPIHFFDPSMGRYYLEATGRTGCEFVVRRRPPAMPLPERESAQRIAEMHHKLFPGLRPRTERPPPPVGQGGRMHRAGLSWRQFAETLDTMSTVSTGLTVDERRKAAGMPPLPPPTRAGARDLRLPQKNYRQRVQGFPRRRIAAVA